MISITHGVAVVREEECVEERFVPSTTHFVRLEHTIVPLACLLNRCLGEVLIISLNRPSIFPGLAHAEKTAALTHSDVKLRHGMSPLDEIATLSASNVENFGSWPSSHTSWRLICEFAN